MSEFYNEVRSLCVPIEEWHLKLCFSKSSSNSFPAILKIAESFKTFKIIEDSDGSIHYQTSFNPLQIIDFEKIYSKVKNWKSIIIYVNDNIIEKTDFNKWLRCYRDKLKTQYSNPLYCFGASPWTFNVFGCHRAKVRDYFTTSHKCWYQFGQMEGDVFVLNKDLIFRYFVDNIRSFKFCPALNPAFLESAMNSIPDKINPKQDNKWEYITHGSRNIGVVPKEINLMNYSHHSIIGNINLTVEVSTSYQISPQFFKLLDKIYLSKYRLEYTHH